MSLDLTPGFPSRRRADEFARLLDGGGSTTDPALSPLLGLARSLQALPLGPSADFRDTLRQRLVAVATVSAHNAPAAAPARGVGALTALDRKVGSWRAQRRLAVAAGAMASVVAVAGVGLAGNRSLPGDPLYGIKRGTEAIELATTHGLVARGELHLRLAKERLREVERLSGAAEALGLTAPASAVAPLAPAPAFGGSLSSKIVSTLERMDSETLAGSADLTKAYKADRDTAPLEVLVAFTRAQQQRLNAVLPDLPDAARSAAVASLTVLDQVDAAAGDLLSGGQCTQACRPTPAPTPTAGPPVTAPEAPCTCGGQPAPSGGEQPGTPEPTPSATDSAEPTPTPDRSATPSPSPSPSGLVDTVKEIINNLPTPLPTPLPTAPPLPSLAPAPAPTIGLP